MAAMTRRFVHRLRVRYHECDLQGVVFNANYLAYFDIALTEFMRETLGSYQELRANGLDLLVVEATVRSARRRASTTSSTSRSSPPRSGAPRWSPSSRSRGPARPWPRAGWRRAVDVEAQTKVEIPAWVRDAVDPWSAPAALA